MCLNTDNSEAGRVATLCMRARRACEPACRHSKLACCLSVVLPARQGSDARLGSLCASLSLRRSLQHGVAAVRRRCDPRPACNQACTAPAARTDRVAPVQTRSTLSSSMWARTSAKRAMRERTRPRCSCTRCGLSNCRSSCMRRGPRSCACTASGVQHSTAFQQAPRVQRCCRNTTVQRTRARLLHQTHVTGSSLIATLKDRFAAHRKIGNVGAVRCARMQAVGEVPEEHRSAAAPMDVDPPSTSQENSPAQGSAANNGKPEKATPKWKTRGLRPLRAPHVRPLDHQVVHQTMRDSVVTDWDLWEAVVDDAVRCVSPCARLALALACGTCVRRACM